MPLSRSLGDGLFELRFSLGSTARRITYRFTDDGRIVLLTTFRKQRDNEWAEAQTAAATWRPPRKSTTAIAHAQTSVQLSDSASACSRTVRAAFSCLSGG